MTTRVNEINASGAKLLIVWIRQTLLQDSIVSIILDRVFMENPSFMVNYTLNNYGNQQSV